MKTNYLRLLSLLLVLAASHLGYAYDISSNGIFYNIISSSDKTLAVTANPRTGSPGSDGNAGYTGAVTIPPTVYYGGQTYTVVSLESECFRNSDITSIILPNTLEIIGNQPFIVTDFNDCTLTIPRSVRSYNGHVIWACFNFTTVRVFSPTPVSCGNAWGYMQYIPGSTLIVPYGSKNAYQRNSGWNVFSQIIEADPILVSSITLNQHDLELESGASTTLTATVLPVEADNPTLTWTSSNTSVVTVDANGTVTAVNSGTAYIKASSSDGSNISDYCTIHVPDVKATSITLSSHNEFLEIGQTMVLTAKIEPETTTDKSITWSSSNASIATVDEAGCIKAFNAGTVQITATTNDGSNLSDICNINVIRDIANADRMAINDFHIQYGIIKEVYVNLYNEESFTAFQCDITLPDGLSFIYDNVEEEYVTPTDRINRHMLTSSLRSDGTLRVTALSPSNKLIGGTSGTPVFSFFVQANNSFKEGVITISEVVLSRGTGDEGDSYYAPETTCEVRSALMGDVNLDGEVNIADINAVIDVILSGNPNQNYAPDVNIDGEINIADINTIIDLILCPPSANKTFTVNGVTFKMIAVEGGTFTMGATPEQGSDVYYWENPPHNVTLSSFRIGETEVTQALWIAVMGSNPSDFSRKYGFTEDLSRPVENVSWDDCQEFITMLNQLLGKSFRLPTEAEWEFAARGGNKSRGFKYAGSNNVDEVAWWGWECNGNSEYGTNPVATKSPNELGLYDMSGNVLEWCQDWFRIYDNTEQTNPSGPDFGSYHIFRGGCWRRNASNSRVAFRAFDDPTFKFDSLGLRLAL